MQPNGELLLYFLIGLAFTLFFPALFPSLKVFFFIPFIIRSFYLKRKKTALWLAFLCGIILDLLSANQRFGLYSCNYVCTAYWMYNSKHQFFEDSFTTLPMMTYLFSLISTALQILLLLLLDRGNFSLSFRFLFTDLFLMPIADLLFALLIFSLPALFFGKPIKQGSDYFAS